MTGHVTLEELVGQLKHIPAKWLDDNGRKVLESITSVVERIDDLTLDPGSYQNHPCRRFVCIGRFSPLSGHVSRHIRE